MRHARRFAEAGIFPGDPALFRIAAASVLIAAAWLACGEARAACPDEAALAEEKIRTGQAGVVCGAPTDNSREAAGGFATPGRLGDAVVMVAND